MITIKEAYDKARVEFPEYGLAECLDIGDAFAFYFSPNEESIPGIPYISVSKKTNEVEMLNIPPLKNLHLIRNGKRLDIEQLVK